MAETVVVNGEADLRRDPLGVLGLTFITLGIYAFDWWWKINDELLRVEGDDSISPNRPPRAMLFGWIIIVPHSSRPGTPRSTSTPSNVAWASSRRSNRSSCWC